MAGVARQRSGLRAFCGDRSGSTAVELALVAPAFLLLLAFWVELGLSMFTQVVLDNATRDAARLIKVGTITGTSTANSNAFDTKLCSKVSTLIPCASMRVRVTSNSTGFGSLSATYTTNSSGELVESFDAGDKLDFVLVQVAYSRRVIVPMVSSIFGTNGKQFLMSSVPFRNENWQ